MLLGVQENTLAVGDPRGVHELLVLRGGMAIDDRGLRLLPDELAVSLGRCCGAQRVLVELDRGETGRGDAICVNDRAVVRMDHRLCDPVSNFDTRNSTQG